MYNQRSVKLLPSGGGQSKGMRFTISSSIFTSVLLLWFFAFPTSAQTVIGGSTPDPSAMLDVQSTGKGVLFPRMTESQRNAITSPATGLIIFNTDIEGLEINLGVPTNPSWQVILRKPGLVSSILCNSYRLVGSYLRTTAASFGNSLRVPYTGGNGGPHSGQIVTSTGVTGLTAVLAPGSFTSGADSLTYNISGTPTASGLAVFALSIGGQTCTLTVPVGCGAFVAAGQWKVFACYNQGASSTSVDPFTPSWEIIGDYWQWGTSTKAGDGPTNGTAGINPNEGAPSVWNTTVAADGSWDDNLMTNPMPNSPCDLGYRVPTEAQWNGVTISNPSTAIGTWTAGASQYDSGRKFGDNLFLPAAGGRFDTNGTLFARGSSGRYWTSTSFVSGLSSTNLSFNLSGYFIASSNRTYGYSVRCIKE